MIGIEVFGQPSAGVCVIAAFSCDDSDFSSSRCEYSGPGCHYSGTEEVGSGPSFEVMIILYLAHRYATFLCSLDVEI